MALDKLIDSAELDANLTAVADAIRTKGGTTEALSFPDGFVSAVEGIQAGGGGDDSLLLSVLDKSVTVLDKDNVLTIGADIFKNDKNLSYINLPNAVTLGNSTFYGCSELQEVRIPKATSLGQMCFAYCSKLKSITLQEATTVGADCFASTAMESADCYKINSLTARAFKTCSNLKTLIIRKSDGICTLANITVFDATPFASGGTGGTVYVPSALISQYQQATNWSTLYAAGTCNFVAIEGSEYE